MKKFAIFAAFAAVAFGFTACSDDDTPVYQQPAEGSFVLNTPPMANQTYDLASSGPVVLTCSQPDYGFVASVNYSAEMTVTDPTGQDDPATYNLTTATPTSAVISLNPTEIATGMCVLNGIANEKDWDENPVGAGKVWIRVVAMVGNYENTVMKSNWVVLNNVVPFFAVPQPGKIYLVGDCAGWVTPDEGNAEHYADWALSEPEGDGIGSKIYYGTFDVPEGKAMFRFYVKLTGWDGGDSWGYQVEDNATDFGDVFGEGQPTTFTSELVNGKGSFNFPNWPGGMMTIVVDMNTHTMSVEAAN